MKRRLWLAGALASASLAFLPSAIAFPEGALLGHTGGFGEGSCASCHFGGSQGDDIALRVEGVDVYAPGERYRFFVRVMDADAAVAGFQLSARFEDGASAGQLGAGSGSQTGTLDEVIYASHSAPQPVEDGEAVWELEWVAPEDAAQPVILHAASVSGADDQSPIGDNVLTLELRMEPAE
ncbi:choice-of-anchor V domain-containing protein [Glycocaulis sp.]|uniref:choice-of-anchor V domain-containing protein n=1 Tax=Glycocaulis sp. TaxID=1969725 RepID=UPI003D25F15D